MASSHHSGSDPRAKMLPPHAVPSAEEALVDGGGASCGIQRLFLQLPRALDPTSHVCCPPLVHVLLSSYACGRAIHVLLLAMPDGGRAGDRHKRHHHRHRHHEASSPSSSRDASDGGGGGDDAVAASTPPSTQLFENGGDHGQPSAPVAHDSVDGGVDVDSIADPAPRSRASSQCRDDRRAVTPAAAVDTEIDHEKNVHGPGDAAPSSTVAAPLHEVASGGVAASSAVTVSGPSSPTARRPLLRVTSRVR